MVDIKDFIASKMEQLQSIERERSILISGLNNLLEIETEKNISFGDTGGWQGERFEVIDFKPPIIRSWESIDDLKYNALCLRMIDGEIDNSKFAERIRLDKNWYSLQIYGKRKAQLKEYYEKNVIKLTQKITVKFK